MSRELCSPCSPGSTRANGRKSLVERALAISFEVQGNVSESRGLQAAGDGCCHFGREGARHFFGRDFHACQLVVEAHAELAKSKIPQGCFAALDEVETLGGHFRAVRQTRSETSRSGAVPRWQTGAAREKANLGLAQAGIEKWRQDLMLRGSAMAGTKIESVIGVYSVGDGCKSSCLRQFVQCGKQFVFAEIAAVGGVGAVSGIVHFVRFDEFMPQTYLAYKFLDDGAIVSGVTRRERSNG